MLFTPCNTCLEKGNLVLDRDIALSPLFRFSQLGAPIQSITGLATPLPLCGVLTNRLLQANVLACLTQPICQTRPLADQRLVADLDSGCPCTLIRGVPTL